MADEGMSIVPYASNLDVVLRHNESVVVFDRDSQQLVLRNAADHGDDVHCPYCRRPLMRERNSSHDNHGSSTQPEFINPEYFRMLHNSLPSSVNSSNPPSPRGRYVQPVLADGPTSEPSYSGATGHGISSAAFTQDYFKKFFVEEKLLGKGGKGVVLLVKHVLDGVSLGQYACKRVPVGDDHEWLEKVLGEVQLLQHLTHQNLVSYRHVWLENAKISTFGPSVPCAFILQQYCNAGDLHNYICGSMQTSTTTQELKERLRRKSRGGLEPPTNLREPRKLQFDEIYSFFKDITSGLRYLHANGYIHRDLKPNNCLLHKTSDGIRVLVSDFGEVQPQNAMRMSTGATGTVSYCAPEVLRREYPDGPFGNFTFKSDIFSLGMILYFLCFAQLPYRNADLIHEEREDLDQLREEISQWSGFDHGRRMRPELPDQLYFFLWHLLSVDPDRRPSAEEILSALEVNANDKFRAKRASSSSHPVSSSFSQPSLSPKRAFARNSAGMRRDSVYDSNGSMADLASVYEGVEQVPERRASHSPERDLIVRRRFSSTPTVSPTPNDTREVGNEHKEPPIPQLLPPPPGRFSLSRLLSALSMSQPPLPVIQLAFFLVKVAIVYQPCSPLAVNPWVLYFLILIAGMNIRMRNIMMQVISLLLHLMIVVLCMKLDLLCVWHSSSGAMFGK